MQHHKIHTNQIRPFPEGVFRVVVEGNGEGDKTEYTVSLREDYYEEMTGGEIAPEDLIKKSFEFLLTREPKESILKEFELPLIQKYFPEYESEMRKNLIK